MSKVAVVAKSVITFFTALGTWGGTAMLDGQIDGVEWFGLCGVVVATALVYAIPNAENRKRDSKGRFKST